MNAQELDRLIPDKKWRPMVAGETAEEYEAEWSPDGGNTWFPVGAVKRIRVTEWSLGRGMRYRCRIY